VDGIPFNDTNSPTHHSWAFFPSQFIAGIDFDRSPGSAATIGPTNFGGSINLLSRSVPYTIGAGLRQGRRNETIVAVSTITALGIGCAKAASMRNVAQALMLAAPRLVSALGAFPPPSRAQRGGFSTLLGISCSRCILAVWVVGLVCVSAASAQQQAIDPEKSTMTVRVFKAGILSALGHDHEIAAPIAGGTVDTGAHSVELRVNASALRVRDAHASDKDLTQIQGTMLGPEVLDAGKYPGIAFRSTGAEPMAAAAWRVRGNLTLHGQTRPVQVEVREEGGHFIGSSRFKQTDFGIKPVKVAGGSIRVKDEVRIEFDIQLAR
jgi:polyisoprenoid-binding protein YceI